MRPAVPDLHVGLPHLMIWLVVVLLIVAGYLFYLRWRRRHPKVVQRETSYSEKLQRRLAKSQHHGNSPAAGTKSRGARPKPQGGSQEHGQPRNRH